MSGDRLVNQLLSRWEECRRQGQTLSAEDLCQGHPEVLEEVRRQVAALRDFDACGTAALTRTGQLLPAGDAEAGRPDIPGHEVLGELGRGGMGVVYKARHLGLKRLVAVKRILAGGQGSSGRARFLREAEAVARLQHPNVVQIFELGEAGGLPYCTLEYVEGGSLDRRLDGTPWPARQAARLVQTLAGAVQAAHAAGIVHRDLKPANVLLSFSGGSEIRSERFCEPLLNEGVLPKVTDFGLAKHLVADGAALCTQDGAVGTPCYMAPSRPKARPTPSGRPPTSTPWA